MFRKILVPTEFGPCSDRAIEFAKRMASPGATLRLLYVLDEGVVLPFDGVLDVGDLESSAMDSLEKLKKKHSRGKLKIQVALKEGAVHEAVFKELRESHCDLCVAGSHGRKGLRRLLLGSVAERLVRGAPVPVCVVKPTLPKGRKIKKIAFATDFSDASFIAFETFRHLVHESGAKGFVLHVLEDAAWMADFAIPTATVEENWIKLREHRKTQMNDILEGLRSEKVKVEGKLLSGQPWSALSSFLKKNEIDLLVLGTHGYRGLDRFFMGSVAEKTLRMVESPVLVVPTSPV